MGEATDNLAVEVGRALRRARLAQGLTLRAAEQASGGRYKPSSIAGYERGERKITVERFCELAAFYHTDPSRLLTDALAALSLRERGEVVVDLTSLRIILPDLEEDERRLLEEYVGGLQERLGPGETVKLGANDIEWLAAETGRDPRDLLARLHAAMVGDAEQPNR
jgi:transcriptional regulator with XRE-family HTH domain